MSARDEIETEEAVMVSAFSWRDGVRIVKKLSKEEDPI